MSSPRRILFAIRTYPPDQVGGAARSTQNLAEALQARGHDVHIVRLAPKGQQAALRQAAEQAGLIAPGKPQIHFLPIRNIYWPHDLAKRGPLRKSIWHLLDLHNLRARRDFARLLRTIKPDIVNTSVIDGFSSAIFGAAKASGAKLIHTMRDYYLICTRSGMFKDGHNCTRLCASCRLSATARRRDAGDVDLFLANSGYVADTHVQYGAIGPNQPVQVQLNINERPLVPEPRTLRDEIVFGFIGRISPTKGIDKLLEATILLAPEGRPWRLDIAGAGEEGLTRALTERYGGDARIHFRGWMKPEDLYGAIDVLICPSTYNEPLPRVIYEGYGFALPAIAADTGGIPEVLEDGVTGLIYPAQDTTALARALDRFRTMPADEYRRFSAAALARGAHYQTDAVVDSFEARVEALLAA
ncbi:glycosyltransferase involved in cell wall biosynthesis [Sphingomonas vulcanisoli]|uniref:Glycosyltransferase involved in cell wall biosynthesis n=1 Tax=Sphingomonas vulcanisoli TaxID=1658060 RepID=A0ABX0TUR5_9SPHN|nr:glycosyltransferase family 4 protein [Sphingomonas vulcanisoli]NIJ08070.1 glycosyltransferase involved in cell wall biosynthesis [Sphingomonas vulcanisoli]